MDLLMEETQPEPLLHQHAIKTEMAAEKVEIRLNPPIPKRAFPCGECQASFSNIGFYNRHQQLHFKRKRPVVNDLHSTDWADVAASPSGATVARLDSLLTRKRPSLDQDLSFDANVDLTTEMANSIDPLMPPPLAEQPVLVPFTDFSPDVVEEEEDEDYAEDESQKTKRKRSGRRKEILWKFMAELLRNPSKCPRIIRWINEEEGIFKIVISTDVALEWARATRNPDMNYEKLSRALRHYYKTGILTPVPGGQKLVYRFGSTALRYVRRSN